MSASYRVQADIPEAFAPLFNPYRYKVAYGGRGGAKSWNFARTLLITGAQRPRRVLCAREFQNSISDSVHRLLADQVSALNLGGYYEVQNNKIIGPAGTEFIFIGLRTNIGNMKSYEGVDVCWVEEAKDVTKVSWEVLVPTIRKDDSEIWVSFNPELESDETYQRFVAKPPPNAWVKKVGWRDNPWFPKVLRDEMELLKERDYKAYLNVWEGECRAAVEGAIFASELEAATITQRIRDVSYDPTKLVHTAWDLGESDSTAIWFVQMDKGEYRFIDFYQAHGHKIGHYMKVLRDKPFTYGDTWLPHDAANEVQSAESSILKQIRAHNLRAKIIPRLTKRQRIEAGRSIFPRCWFDATRCADGLQSLRHYRYDLKQDGLSLSKEPVHDWASHGADAFTHVGVAVRELPAFPLDTTAQGQYSPLDGAPAQIPVPQFVRPYDDFNPDGMGRNRTIEETYYDPTA